MMARSGNLCVVVVLLVLGMVAGQYDSSVCKPEVPATSTKRPVLSDVFRVSVECNLKEKNYTTYVREYYDYKQNKGRLRLQDPYQKQEVFYDYNNNDILVINPDTSSCNVGLLELSGDRFVFGARVNGESTTIYSPAGALHFATGNETYMGQTSVRGIVVDYWDSCQYMAGLTATAKVTWYFSSKVAWDTQIGFKTVPVRMTAEGLYTDKDSNRVAFNHQYEFFDFEDSLNPEDFTIPSGIYCLDRITSHKQFPSLPNYFSFQGESADNYQDIFTVVEEYYDNTTGLTGYFFKVDFTHLTGVNEYFELNDYNSGASYVIDRASDACTITSVKSGALAFSKTVNSRTVRMETPHEFFEDSNMNYQYSGQTLVRGVPCDRWVGTTNKARGYENTTVTVEWYFASTSYSTWNTQYDLAGNLYRVPMLYRLFLPGAVLSDSSNFNIFYFNTNEPPLAEADVSSCFTGTQRKSFRFTFPSSAEPVVRSNILQTKQSIREWISLSTGISRIRVSDVEFYFDTAVHVTFDLLDKPTYYNDVPKTMTENTLDAAAQLLTQAFNAKTISLSVVDGTTVKTVNADTGSLEDITQLVHMIGSSSSDSGYSSGALAGLAIAMLVAGGAGGAVGAFFFLK